MRTKRPNFIPSQEHCLFAPIYTFPGTQLNRLKQKVLMAMFFLKKPINVVSKCLVEPFWIAKPFQRCKFGRKYAVGFRFWQQPKMSSAILIPVVKNKKWRSSFLMPCARDIFNYRRPESRLQIKCRVALNPLEIPVDSWFIILPKLRSASV